MNTTTPAAPEGGRPLARIHWRNVSLLGGSLAALASLFVVLLRDPAVTASLGDRLTATFGELGKALREEFFLNPWFYAVVAGVLLLERLIPADPGQGLLSKGARQDLVWVPFKLLVHASFIPAVIVLLRLGYDRYLGFLTIDAVASWPAPGRIVLAVLWGDFLFWLIHYIRHKVFFLWCFHAVHHSQKELNFFTEYRVHPIDDVFAITLGVIPILMLEPSFVTVTAIVWVRHWHTRICHSNIRTNFGPLKYILVTPQSHRVHHSVDEVHHDKNFGLTFSIWDHLFGTQHREYDIYPETGINDRDFPFEQNRRSFASLNTLLSQLIYPFQAVSRRD
ncbi:MAG TPA: hypothetical protein DD490_10425 [Acidobacteria bacterium]|nr:hypothetical protein [Acidobacteriota bacterium]